MCIRDRHRAVLRVRLRAEPGAQSRLVCGGAAAERIRNIGVIAHVDAGKTTTTERMLHLAGVTNSLGGVDDGNTVTDYMDQERERGITIQSAAISFDWEQARVNLIDTPGHADFTVEVERAVRVLDGAVCILDGVAGVEAQTQAVWRQASYFKLPAIAFVNKMDRIGASFAQTVEDMGAKLDSCVPLPFQVPILEDEAWCGTLDVLTGDLVEGKPGQMSSEQKKVYREQLVEMLSCYDDVLMEQCLNLMEEQDSDTAQIPTDLILAAAARATQAGGIVPVLMGSSLHDNGGVSKLLDCITTLLPPPTARQAPELQNHDPSKKPALTAAALAFKVIHDSQQLPIVFTRVYSGKIEPGQVFHNTITGKHERVLRVQQIRGGKMIPVDSLKAGDIGALVGLKNTRTGDTLLSPKSAKGVFEGVKIPPAVFLVALELETASQEAALDKGLRALCQQDPSLISSSNLETGQVLLSGMGELHLELAIDRLQREFRVKGVQASEVQIAYREAILSKEATFHSETIQPPGVQLLPVEMSGDLAPLGDPGDSTEIQIHFERQLEKSLKHAGVEAVTEGVHDACERGTLLGFPVGGIRVQIDKAELLNERATPAEMTASLRLATRKWCSTALAQASPALLQPMMKLELNAPTEHVGAVLSDLVSRRAATVSDVHPLRTGAQLVRARAPLSHMVGYSSILRSLTKGHGSFSLELHQYGVMDPVAFDQLVQKMGGLLPPG
eukprot:TRINITY_DN10781_c0_g1_i28.p1 TRINITY_DN10781_c0_g1~~TRINITY_DN10781_c0_g1_i28.p1  ORF type:complete len:728 (-),score=145.71 TRINITY_DN10781_c0_g1_i28:250-2433(-)